MKIYWYEGKKNICGERVKKARSKLTPSITQVDLAARLETLGLNMDRVSVSKIESGDRFVADYEIIALAKALNVSVGWLLGETGETSK